MKILKKGLLFAISFVLVINFVSCGDNDYEVKEISPQIKNEIEDYNRKANKDGISIIDMDNDPYFMQIQDGYKYETAKTIKYYSSVTKTKRHAKVLLPVNYDKKKNYPVLYLLHGLGGSHNTWINKDADIIIQNLMYFENVPEMIVVFPNSQVNKREDTEGLSLNEQANAFDKTEEDLIKNLMPYINRHYRVKTGKENTAIAGNSMGGRNAITIAFKHQELFGYVGGFSSSHVIDDSNSSSVLKATLKDFIIKDKNDTFKKIMLCVGDKDYVCGGESYIIHDRMNNNGINHVFYKREGGHENKVWQNGLYNFLKMIFI